VNLMPPAVLAIVASISLAACSPPTGGILVDGPKTRYEGETCASGNLVCLQQEAVSSSGCPAKGSKRTVTAKSVKDGARVAVRFEFQLSPDDSPELPEAEVRTFSQKQSTASLGCDTKVDGANKARYVQLKYVCARELGDLEPEPLPAAMTCTQPVPVFDPNTLPSKPMAVALFNSTRVYGAISEPRFIRAQAPLAAEGSSCRSSCEDVNSGDCVRVLLESSRFTALAAPAVPNGNNELGRFEKARYMSSLGVDDDPCMRSDLNFQAGVFSNTGSSCTVAWNTAAIGNVTISLPDIVAATVSSSGNKTSMKFIEGQAISIQFSDVDLQGLGGLVSQLDVDTEAIYARLPSVCVSVKPSLSKVAIYASVAQAVFSNWAASFSGRAREALTQLPPPFQ
jgi:hypothetical protein